MMLQRLGVLAGAVALVAWLGCGGQRALRYLAGGSVAAGCSSTAHCRLFQGTPAMAGTTARWFKGLLQLLACH